MTPEEQKNIADRLAKIAVGLGITSDNPNRLRFSDLKIRTKDKRLIPFRPNKVQTKFIRDFDSTWTPEKPPPKLTNIRDLNLKGRQFGITTMLAGWFFIDTQSSPNTASVMMAHDADASERLFRIIQTFHENLIKDYPNKSLGRPKYSTKRELFWPESNASFFIGTAGSDEFGRSMTVNNAHLSELAFWKGAESITASLMQTIPREGNVFGETTANGYGNFFQSEWELANQFDEFGRRRSSFTPKFWCWLDHEEYSIPLKEDEEPELTDEEWELKRSYGMSFGQVLWMREKKLELKEKFDQEYPLTPDLAFITTGNPFFSIGKVVEVYTRLQHSDYDPIPFDFLPIPTPFSYLRDSRDELFVWEAPIPGEQYVIGADTAQGLDQDGKHDNCVADVFKKRTREQVAQWVGQWPDHEFAQVVGDLGWWYQLALLGIERNEYGHSVLNTLLNVRNYPKMLEEGPGGIYLHEEYDEHRRLSRRKPGWPTTPRTRAQMLSGLHESFEEGDIILRSRQTLSEFRTFNKKNSGKIEAESGKHDDCVFSCAIADALMRLYPMPVSEIVAVSGVQHVYKEPSLAISGRVNTEKPYDSFRGYGEIL